MAASLDDAGQQAEGVGTLGGPGAVADTPGDHPMAQGAFGGVVRQGQFRVVEHDPEGVPVIEHLARKCFGLVVLGVDVVEAGSKKLGEHSGVGFP